MCMSLGSLEIVQELVDGGLERRQRQLRQLCVLARVEATRVYNIINIILIAKNSFERKMLLSHYLMFTLIAMSASPRMWSSSTS